MPRTLALADAVLDDTVAAVTDRCDGGRLRVYSGTQPNSADDAASGTLLAELTFGSPAFSITDGIATANAIASDIAEASGNAAWFRAVTFDGLSVFDGSVGTHDADLIIDDVAIVSGELVSVTSLTYEHPEPEAPIHGAVVQAIAPAVEVAATGTYYPAAPPPSEFVIYGFGSGTTGGTGGTVHNVTNVTQLRSAINASGTRIIRFTVGGEYNLAGVNLSLTNGNVTIDGSPASTPVVLYNGMLVVRTNNVIVRHVRFRSTGPNLSPGDGDTDAVSVGVYNGSTRYNNIVFDHCEMIWGPDVSLTAFNLVDSTFQYCIISEGLFASVHPQSYGGPDGDADGHGLAANFVSFHPSGTERMTVYNNIVSTSQSRQPRFQNCTQVDVINNIFYNYHEGPQGAVYGLNLMNNYYKEGPAPAAAGLSSPVKLQWRTQVGGPMSTAPSQSVYLSGNHAANFTFAAQTGSNGTVIATTPRHTPSISGGNLRSATDAYTHVLANAGPRLPSVDATTQRLLNDVANGTGKYRSGYRWSTNTHFYPPVEHSW